jgi:hypothetical protein
MCLKNLNTLIPDTIFWTIFYVRAITICTIIDYFDVVSDYNYNFVEQ